MRLNKPQLQALCRRLGLVVEGTERVDELEEAVRLQVESEMK